MRVILGYSKNKYLIGNEKLTTFWHLGFYANWIRDIKLEKLVEELFFSPSIS